MKQIARDPSSTPPKSTKKRKGLKEKDMLRAIKRLLVRGARHLGYDIVSVSRTSSPSPLSLQAAFGRIAHRMPQIATVIDVGASDGRWSLVAQQFYPDANYFLIEANPLHEEPLQQFAAFHPGIQYVVKAAGDKAGEVFFDVSTPFGGVASHDVRTGYQPVPMTTIDAEVAQHNLPPPYLIKLDTHGFEVPILKGAASTLEHTEVLIIETYNFRIEPESLLFYEMCAFLDERDFRPIDMCDPLLRPYDRSLWQFDLFFIRQNRPEFSYRQYQ